MCGVNALLLAVGGNWTSTITRCHFQPLVTIAHCECFSEACSYLLTLTVICCHLQLEISTFCLMVKGYLVFENEQIWAEAILQVVLEIFEKNNVTQPSQSSDAYTVQWYKKPQNRGCWNSTRTKTFKMMIFLSTDKYFCLLHTVGIRTLWRLRDIVFL